jgi:hypothetical protein
VSSVAGVLKNSFRCPNATSAAKTAVVFCGAFGAARSRALSKPVVVRVFQQPAGFVPGGCEHFNPEYFNPL